jgi:tRNA A-37 threonylcarbamoyl transferase component Bud32
VDVLPVAALLTSTSKIGLGPGVTASGEAAPPAAPHAPPAKLAQPIIDRVLRHDPEFARFFNGQASRSGLADFLFISSETPHEPKEMFAKLRWGGLLVFVSSSAGETAALSEQYSSHGFAVEQSPTFIRLSFPLFRKLHYFISRKVHLIQPGEDTDRFTYHVELVRYPSPQDKLVVLKEVPTVEAVVSRLHRRWPEMANDVIEKRARKFTEKIFPTFLTREAAILKILERDLPAPYNRRVPRVINLEKDKRGFVRKLYMHWLQNGGQPLSHMEFAHQSADLLRVMHDIAHVIHLDLRLDNMVITEDGVGFVDFGSSVRDDENLAENPLLASLFDELMRTSHIQVMLEKMTTSGAVTSQVISRGLQKVDKAIDFFYLAVQFNAPHQNPDLTDLILYDPKSDDARHLEKLTKEILRPADPANPAFRSAKDILHGIERIQLKLDRPPR